jgi:hypothetical protein
MDQVGNLLDRPRLYWNIDGVAELGGGIMSLGIALLLLVDAHSPEDSLWHHLSFLFFVALILGIYYGVPAIKTHITYPRTGFVEYRRAERRRISIIATVAGALIPVALVVAVRRHWDITTPAALIGLVFAAAYSYQIARAAHWKWAIASAIALGSIVIAFLPASFLAALANDSLVIHPVQAKLWGTIIVSFMAYGSMLLISGSISFWLYLRHTQTPGQEGQ